VVECTALEMRHTCKRIGGSNPSLSAKKSYKYLIFQDNIIRCPFVPLASSGDIASVHGFRRVL
jgi:hypothetical protein